MSDLPPSYSFSDLQPRRVEGTQRSTSIPSRYIGHIQHELSDGLRRPNFSSVDDYVHRSEAYATFVAFKENPFNANATDRSLSTIHFSPLEPSSSKDDLNFAPLSESMKLEMLSMVQGFGDCGSFSLARERLQGHGPEAIRRQVHDKLIRQLCHPASKDVGLPDSDDYAATEMIVQQRQGVTAPLEPNEDGDTSERDALVVHLYKFHVFSKYAASFSDKISLLVYKWAKPQSVYGRLEGSWEANLIDVINDGVLNAGRELMVLVRGVSEQQMTALQDRWQEGARVKEF